MPSGVIDGLYRGLGWLGERARGARAARVES
jgi:hypothetical protein